MREHLCVYVTVNIAAGKVSDTIKDWKNEIRIPNIEEIRKFVVLVKKSGITIEQCAQGYRMINLMKNLGINDDENWSYDDNITNNNNNNKHHGNNNFSFFVNELYQNCKKFGVSAYIIHSWIKDLFDCYSSLNADTKTSCLINEENLMQKSQSPVTPDPNLKINAKNIISSQSPNKSSSTAYSNPIINDNFNLDVHGTKEGLGDFGPDELSSPTPLNNNRDEVSIPFISNVSYYISQTKNECTILESYKKRINDQIIKLNTQKELLQGKIDELAKKEKIALNYLDWFSNLKKEMMDRYNIDITDTQKFAKVFNEFKIQGYDANEIIYEYSQTQSLRRERDAIQTGIELNQTARTDLLIEINSLQTRLDAHKQTLAIYKDLEAMKFGLKELKQLRNKIIEIATANNFESKEGKAVSKFLKDIDEDYDDKLGFESKINELKEQMKKIKNELPGYRNSLELQTIVGPLLINLNRYG